MRTTPFALSALISLAAAAADPPNFPKPPPVNLKVEPCLAAAGECKIQDPRPVKPCKADAAGKCEQSYDSQQIEQGTDIPSPPQGERARVKAPRQ